MVMQIKAFRVRDAVIDIPSNTLFLHSMKFNFTYPFARCHQHLSNSALLGKL